MRSLFRLKTSSPERRFALPLVLVLVLVTLGLTGCKTGEPGVTNTLGTVQATVQAQPSDAVAAAERAVKGLGLMLLQTKHDYEANSAELVVRSEDGHHVAVGVEPVGQAQVEISIRYGWTGDEELGLTILDRFKRELKKASPDADADADADGATASHKPV